MQYYRLLLAVVVDCVLLLEVSSGAQEARTDPDLKVFLDCPAGCDEDYLRTEVVLARWVRDSADADVHLMITWHESAGATEYEVVFLGKGRFASRNDTLQFMARATQTADQVRARLARMITAGLLPYVVKTPMGARVRVILAPPRQLAADIPANGPLDDPWHGWVFQLSLNGTVDGEASVAGRTIDGSLSARRATPDWRTDLVLKGLFERRRFDLADNRRFTSDTHDVALNGLLARGVNDRWSIGLNGALSSSTRLNQNLSLGLAPAIEFTVLPYREFTRRRVVMRYSTGVQLVDYEQPTIYGHERQRLHYESLVGAVAFNQPWGTVQASLEGLHYFHALKRYRLKASTNWDIRLFRGFSLNLSGHVSRIRDQLHIARGGATDEEVLLRIKQLATSHEYNLGVGFRYTFGSVYSQIVSPRFI